MHATEYSFLFACPPDLFSYYGRNPGEGCMPLHLLHSNNLGAKGFLVPSCDISAGFPIGYMVYRGTHYLYSVLLTKCLAQIDLQVCTYSCSKLSGPIKVKILCTTHLNGQEKLEVQRYIAFTEAEQLNETNNSLRIGGNKSTLSAISSFINTL